MTVVDLNRTKRVHKRAPRDLVPIDKTGGAARFFDRMVRQIEVDLGRRRHLTHIEGELVRAFAGAATVAIPQPSSAAWRNQRNRLRLRDVASTMLRISSSSVCSVARLM